MMIPAYPALGDTALPVVHNNLAIPPSCTTASGQQGQITVNNAGAVLCMTLPTFPFSAAPPSSSSALPPGAISEAPVVYPTVTPAAGASPAPAVGTSSSGSQLLDWPANLLAALSPSFLAEMQAGGTVGPETVLAIDVIGWGLALYVGYRLFKGGN